jgi:hypothetical protein
MFDDPEMKALGRFILGLVVALVFMVAASRISLEPWVLLGGGLVGWMLMYWLVGRK